MKRKLTIPMNRGQLYFNLSVTIVIFLSTVFTTILSYNHSSNEDPARILSLVGFFMVGCFAIPAVIIATPHRTCFVWLTISEKGVEYRALFRKKQVRSFSEYAYWYHGKYFHGYRYIDFIVLSNKRLSTKELWQINQVAPSANLLKIRYTPKTFQKLTEILPEKQRLQLRGAFPDAAQELLQHRS